MNGALCALLYLLCIVNVSLLLGTVFGCKKKKKTLLFYIFGALAAAVGIGCGFLNDDNAETVTELMLFLCSAALPYLYFEHGKKLTFALVGFTLCSVFDFLEYALISLFSWTAWQKILLVYIGLYGISCLTAWALGRVVKNRIVPDFSEMIPHLVYIVIIVVDYSAYYSLTVINSSESFATAAVVISYGAAILCACCIGYIIYRYAVLSHRRREEEQIHALELKRYEEIVKNNRDMSAYRHDYQNNLRALGTFIETGRIREAKEYISDLTDALLQTKSRCQTGNILADAILSDKAEAAQSSGVNIEFDGAIPAAGIGSMDLCVILSNALDNAVRACGELPTGTVTVKSVLKEQGFVLTVSNPVSGKVNTEGGVIGTTKADKRSHGFGIANIRKTAKKYNGYADIRCDENVFTMEIGLILEQPAPEQTASV